MAIVAGFAAQTAGLLPTALLLGFRALWKQSAAAQPVSAGEPPADYSFRLQPKASSSGRLSLGDLAPGLGVQAGLANAARLPCKDENDWELAAARTQDAFQGLGHGKAVACFVTAYLLREVPQAICHTEASNAAMLHVPGCLGYRPQA